MMEAWILKLAMTKLEIRFNKAYKDAMHTKTRLRILYGGSGSGKSHHVALETLLNMLTNKNFYMLAARKTNKSIRHSVYQLFIDLISQHNLASKFTTNKTEMSIRCINGARLITAGLDDAEKLKSIAGINRIWVEEASECAESDINQLDLRLRGHSEIGHQMTLTFNPISELHWIKKKYFDLPTDAYILKTTYKDNAHIDDEYKQRLEKLQDEDYQYYRIYTLGEWGSLGNLIFTNWKVEDLSSIKHTFDNIYNGLDWGFAADPFAAIRVHLDKTRKKLYIIGEIYRTGLHNDESAALVKALIGNERIVADSAEPKSIADYKRLGINCIGAKKGQGSIEHGIRWLQGHEIIIDNSCTNTIKEISGYKWKEDKNGNVIPRPVDINNHCLTGDTIVNTPDGDYTIKELVGTSGSVYCYDELKRQPTTSIYYDCRMTQEQVDVFEIELEDGRIIKATDYHPVLTQTGWKQVKDIKESDYIIDISETIQYN